MRNLSFRARQVAQQQPPGERSPDIGRTQSLLKDFYGHTRSLIGPSNNAMHQTGREGAAFASRRRPIVEARPAGDCGCCAGLSESEEWTAS